MMRAALAAVLTVFLSTQGAAAQSVVFLVRHAERADAGGAAGGMMKDDPNLSAAGRARAASLATLLKDAGIKAIFTTEFRRTRQTAAPLAKALGIEPTVVPSGDASGLVSRLQALSGNALVVGHSNTIPGIVKSLGVTPAVDIGDTEFDNLFVVVRSSQPALLRLHYR